MKAWLKGGIIGGIIGIILASFVFLLKIGSSSLLEWIIIPIAISFLFFPNCAPKCSSGVCPNPDYCNIIEPISIIILSLIFYFIIGALIGWIIGKLKSKKKK